MNANEIRMKNSAEFKARSLYVDLYEQAGDDTKLLISGLSIAMTIIKNDLVALLPPPPPAAPAPVVAKEPVKKHAKK